MALRWKDYDGNEYIVERTPNDFNEKDWKSGEKSPGVLLARRRARDFFLAHFKMCVYSDLQPSIKE